MRKLPKILKQIIKKKTFSLDTLQPQETWRGGLKIDYRITMVKADGEHQDFCTPLTNSYAPVTVNIKVKGQVETRGDIGVYSKILREISEVTKTKKSYWGGYDTKYDYVWGRQVNKAVRKEIRYRAINDVVNFLKLVGIQTERWSDGISIGTITWEK